jgi:hypothetical protein
MISLLVGTEEPLILDDDSEYHTSTLPWQQAEGAILDRQAVEGSGERAHHP